MAEFLTTEGISQNIRKIIIESRNKLVLISPFIKLSIESFELLKAASTKNVQITFIFGKTTLGINDRNYLKKINNIDIRFLWNLHSKCYLNEASMVITSMNLIEYSQKNNREMGLLVTRKDDKEIFENAVIEIASLINDAKKVDLVRESVEKNFTQSRPFVQQSTFQKRLYKDLMEGHCIRCRTEIPYNRNKPYCEFCYQTWARNKVRDYFESVCHGCGNHTHSTINRPECLNCYSN